MSNRTISLNHLGAASALSLWACAGAGGSDIEAGTIDVPMSRTLPDATLEPGPLDAGCVSTATLACTCAEGGSGVQRCVNGAFSTTCESCSPAVVADRTTKCQPGRYVGMVDVPYYAPAPAGFCGLITVFGGGAKGIMSFTLAAGAESEFISVVGAASCLDLNVVNPDAGTPMVGEGGVVTDADGGTVKTLSLELNGSVSCATGAFEGEIRGTYRSVGFCDLGMMENDYFIKGPVRATFDPARQTFVGGTIELREPPVLLPIGGEAGGSGTWEATLDRNAVAPPPPEKGCLGGVVFRDDLFP